MGFDILFRCAVPVVKQRVEFTLREGTAQNAPDSAQGQGVGDVILQKTGIRTIWLHPVRMVPKRKRPGHLHIAKLLAFLVITMLGDPTEAKRTDGRPQDNPRPIFNPACAL
jgi:hypothetical protein